MITGINELKTLTKHISCKCKCKFDGRKCNSNQKWNNNNCRCECKNQKKIRVQENNYIWNPATCSCKNDKYLASIIDDSMITSNEVIGETKIIPANFNEKKMACKTNKFYNLLAFFILITIALLIVVSI